MSTYWFHPDGAVGRTDKTLTENPDFDKHEHAAAAGIAVSTFRNCLYQLRHVHSRWAISHGARHRLYRHATEIEEVEEWVDWMTSRADSSREMAKRILDAFKQNAMSQPPQGEPIPGLPMPKTGTDD